MKKLILAWVISCVIQTQVKGQDLFNAVFPIGDNPNIGYKTSMVPSIENILFEANPNLRLPIYNNIQAKLMGGNKHTAGSTVYINFNPQIRMYNDVSFPVKTPSYKISLLGFQKLIRLNPFAGIKDHLIAFAIESGHYSNGQSKSAFNKDFDDGSAQSDSVYNLITDATDLSAILNRESGNFSTNFTELVLNYRIISKLDENYKPLSAYSFKVGWNRFHNNLLFIADIGGYTAQDIKIYGKNRWNIGAEYFTTIKESSWFKKKIALDRIVFNANFEYISKPHPSVTRGRFELSSKVYFKRNIGLFISGIFGHDNYNYRFVDNGSQLFAGLTFDVFPPIEIK